MWTLLKALVWYSCWISGVHLFNEVLQPEGAWLMAAGALNYLACQAITDELFD